VRGERYSIAGEKRDGKPFDTLGDQIQSVIRAGMPGGRVDPRLHEVRAATGLSESIPADGGFLVQNDFAQDVLMSSFKVGKLADLCRRVKISNNSNSIKIPGLDESSRANGSRQGGVTSYYVGEASEITASKPTFRKIEMNLKKLCCMVYLTDELMADAAVLDEVVRRAAAHEIAFRVDDGIINGLGAGEILGVMNGPGLVSQSIETGQSTGIMYENITKMWSRLLPGSRENAVFLVSPGSEQSLFHMSQAIGTGGNSVYLPSSGSNVSPYATLMGRPVIIHESMQALNTKGDILLGDFSQGYIFADKGSIKTDVSISVRFQFDEMVMRFIYRIDGCPTLESSGGISPFKGSDKLGHFVTLNARP
jgi:HK97 family phage major capsid protein